MAKGCVENPRSHFGYGREYCCAILSYDPNAPVMTHEIHFFLRRDLGNPLCFVSELAARRVAYCVGVVAAVGGECWMSLPAHVMKYFMFERSSCPPSCWRQASSPSSRPVFT